MRICKPHWQDLRTAIGDRGLSHLISGSGEKLFEKMKNQIGGTDTKEDFDPLANANWAICEEALRCGGLEMMYPDETTGEPRCPLCEAEKNGGAGTAKAWIEGCTDAQREQAVELGLVKEQKAN